MTSFFTVPESTQRECQELQLHHIIGAKFRIQRTSQRINLFYVLKKELCVALARLFKLTPAALLLSPLKDSFRERGG